MKPEPKRQLEFSLGGILERKKPKAEPRTGGFLINPVRVRQYALDIAKRERLHHFTAVSVQFIQRIDARLRNLIRDEIKRHLSRGKRLA